MRIVVQNFKTGALSVAEAPQPLVRSSGVLVRTSASLISAGTDRSIIGLAKKSYLGKALDRPDLAWKVINKAKTDGLWSTYKVVQNLIAEPIPLGYSLIGTVIGIGRDVNDVSLGNRVACAGLGYANHADVISVPRNLFVSVPDNVSDEQASYVTLGAIAMHGIRQANQQFGATVLVVGLGLVGQLTVQMCNAAGYRTLGLDFDPRKLELAKSLGARDAFLPEDSNLSATIKALTSGQGVDAVLLTAASRESGAVFEQVAELCRDRARVVVVGDIKMDISRRTYFEKELEILQSRSYGPGRYDPNYEEKGQDYPIGYVRWTEQRNMSAFLDMVSAGRFDPSRLTTHRFPIEQAEQAYGLVSGKTDELTVGIVLDYQNNQEKDDSEPNHINGKATTLPALKQRIKLGKGKIGLGVIGTGQFAKGVLLPAIMETGGFKVIGVSSARGLSANSVCNRYGGAYADTDTSRLFNDPDINAVLIASRHDSHARYCIEALKHGKHVFVEKPLCLNLEELTAIKAAARESEGTLTVGYNRRFSPLIQNLKRHFDGCVEPMAMIYRINAGRIPLKSEMGWVHDPEVGGGRVIGEVCHFIDTLQFISGARPQTISAFAVNTGNAMLAGNDIVTITIGFDDGASGTIHYFSNGDGSFPKERIEVFCQERIGVLDNFRKLDLVYANKTRSKHVKNLQKGFSEEADAFLAACQEGKSAISFDSLWDTSTATFAAMEALTMASRDHFEEGKIEAN